METMNVYPLTIDYNSSLAALIAAAADRRRDYAAEEITEQNFPLGKGPTKVETTLLKFKQPVRTEETLAEMERSGLRAATLMELMAFAVQYSNKLGFGSIIELGSVWTSPENYRPKFTLLRASDRRYVIYVSRMLSRRILALHRFQGTWTKGDCFLAARK